MYAWMYAGVHAPACCRCDVPKPTPCASHAGMEQLPEIARMTVHEADLHLEALSSSDLRPQPTTSKAQALYLGLATAVFSL